MGAEHPPEIVWKAQELYCVERLTFSKVAKMLGVSDSTVRRWADRFHWREEREAIAAAESEIRANTVKSRAFALRKLLESETGKEVSQVAFAVTSLERLALATARAERKGERGPVIEDSSIPLEKEEDNLSLSDGLGHEERVAVLEQAVNRQISFLLSHPVPDLSRRVRDIKVALDVLTALRGRGHGTGCSVLQLDGEQYIYTSVSVPKGTSPTTDPVNYGTGFSKITWNGSQTTQKDVKHFYNLQDVREAEVAVSQDGRYLVFLSRNILPLEMFNNTNSSAWQIVVFDRKEVEASANPSSVKPLNKWDVSHIRDETASAHASGICSDGRYVYMVFSGAQNIGERSILVYSLSGHFIKTIPVTGFAGIALDEYKKGKDGKVVTAIEIEGLALYRDALVMGNKMTVHTPGDIVSFKGKNFINLTGSKGIRPYSWKDWARTEAEAFSGEYDHSKRYTSCTGPIYHKYMTALVPAGKYDREHEVCGSLYATSHAAVNAFGPRASFAVHDHYAFTVWDRQTDSFLPVLQAMNDGSLRLYDPQGIKDDGASPNTFGRVNYDHSEGMTLSGGVSVADSATIYLRNSQSSDAKYIIFYSGGDRTALMGPTHYTLFYGYIAPREDGVHPLGNVDRRWSEVRAASGTINTSDEREKDLIRDIPEKVFLAWEKVAYKEFVFKSAFEKKGEQARKHMGLIAQQVKAAFESEGLDAFEYGLLCYDSWDSYEMEEEHPEGPELAEVTNIDGTVEYVEKMRTISVTMPAGDRYGIRYDEALALEAAYLRWRLTGLSRHLEFIKQTGVA